MKELTLLEKLRAFALLVGLTLLVSAASTITSTTSVNYEDINVAPIQTPTQPVDAPQNVPVDIPQPTCLSPENTIGDVDNNVDANFYRKGYETERSVARVNLGYGYGTGWLIGDCLFITNNHVIGSRQAAENAVIEFDYMLGDDGKPTVPDSYKVRKGGVFITNAYLDYTIIELEGNPGRIYGSIDLSKATNVDIDSRLNIIGHPEGGVKNTAVQDNKVVSIVNGDFIRYTTDSKGGSSGSILATNAFEPVALHTSGSTYFNQGTLLTSIVADLKLKLTDTSEGSVLAQLGLVTNNPTPTQVTSTIY